MTKIADQMGVEVKEDAWTEKMIKKKDSEWKNWVFWMNKTQWEEEAKTLNSRNLIFSLIWVANRSNNTNSWLLYILLFILFSLFYF